MGHSYYVNLMKVPPELRDGVKRVGHIVALDFQNRRLPEIVFSPGADGVRITGGARKIQVGYGERNDAFRALGLIHARAGKETAALHIAETRKILKTFVMVDVSRNAVFNADTMEEWLVFMALAGLNGFMFYTEDTFKIPGEPLFGYLRGAYSKKELQGFDTIADSLGIEMIPCIQTLAHLQRILCYHAYSKIKDTESVMLCGEAETYRFIEKMLKAAVAPYKSRRIHIGMDEAWDIGRGVFLGRNGYVPPFDIITKHLEKVLKLCRKMGVKPMMWSDMFFRALSQRHQYYDTSIQVTPEIKKAIPADVDQVYWDYHHLKAEDYDGMIDKHVEMGGIPIVAPGVQTWGRFWPAYECAEKTLAPCYTSALKKGVKEMILTLWGDDGTECDFTACRPLLQYAADMSFTGDTDLAYTRENVKGTLGVSYDDWKAGERIDRLPFQDNYTSLSKMLLWEDPMYGLVQPQLDGRKVNGHFKDVAADLKARLKNKRNERLRLPYRLAIVLSRKADLPSQLRVAYRTGDKAALNRYLKTVIPQVIKDIKALNDTHRDVWLRNNKPFGWEILERRYGGLLGVFENLKLRLGAYVTGRVDRLEEFEEKRVKLWDAPASKIPQCGALRLQGTGYLYH
ncbi:MAG: family 20 glycosylhydrolase [bacterium]